MPCGSESDRVLGDTVGLLVEVLGMGCAMGSLENLLVAHDVPNSESEKTCLSGAHEMPRSTEPKVGFGDFKPVLGGFEDVEAGLC